MFFAALATDYDGTLAENGHVRPDLIAGLERLRRSGRRAILVTGRRLDDLERVCPHLDCFDRVVAENGAVLFRPATKQKILLGERPPRALIEALTAADVTSLSVGEVIVATWEPHQEAVLEAIKECGLEHQIIFNKGAVMVLPPGINKASGLAAALAELSLAPINVVAVGDAENDHALLNACGLAVAVANAVPMLKEAADWVTRGSSGDGVNELVSQLLDDDLAGVEAASDRHRILLGEIERGKSGDPPRLSVVRDGRILVCGTSGSGKTTFTTGLLERLSAAGMQYCIIDPEGDYENFDKAVSIGDSRRPPSASKVAELLEEPNQNVAVNLLGIPLADRPGFLVQLASALLELRKRVARPHWLVIDEAHHMLGFNPDAVVAHCLADLSGVVFVTVHPDHMARAVLADMRWIVALGGAVADSVRHFTSMSGMRAPDAVPETLPSSRAFVWRVDDSESAVEIEIIPPEAEHLRHIRKYAEGELGEDRSFYFRGAKGTLNLRAHNLETFCQLANGVDADTWMHHLSGGDYSTWLRDCIKDDELAEEVALIEASADSRTSCREICAAIERRYTKAA
jgi:HAD superfamily hydrolase (TIGR01484 family)